MTDATRPSSMNGLQQQARFDTFVHQFNHERPHQALEMATPASRYQPSARVYQFSVRFRAGSPLYSDRLGCDTASPMQLTSTPLANR